MKVMKEKEDEALVFVGAQPLGREVDFCQLYSRHGNLIVGFTGMDQPEVKVGFLKRIGMMLGGV